MELEHHSVRPVRAALRCAKRVTRRSRREALTESPPGLTDFNFKYDLDFWSTSQSRIALLSLVISNHLQFGEPLLRAASASLFHKFLLRVSSAFSALFVERKRSSAKTALHILFFNRFLLIPKLFSISPLIPSNQTVRILPFEHSS